jgi:hypothetical protein
MKDRKLLSQVICKDLDNSIPRSTKKLKLPLWIVSKVERKISLCYHVLEVMKHQELVFLMILEDLMSP